MESYEDNSVRSLSQRSASRQRPVKGRWSKDEHEHFLKGLDQHGKDWFAIKELFVPSRTVTQIRTHAQKFFKRKSKGLSFPQEPYVDSQHEGGNSLDPSPPPSHHPSNAEASGHPISNNNSNSHNNSHHINNNNNNEAMAQLEAAPLPLHGGAAGGGGGVPQPLFFGMGSGYVGSMPPAPMHTQMPAAAAAPPPQMDVGAAFSSSACAGGAGAGAGAGAAQSGYAPYAAPPIQNSLEPVWSDPEPLCPPVPPAPVPNAVWRGPQSNEYSAAAAAAAQPQEAEFNPDDVDMLSVFEDWYGML